MADDAGVLALLAAAVARNADVEPLAARLCRACLEVLGADGGSITLLPASAGQLTVCTSDVTSARFEDLQDVLGEGPTRMAHTEGRVVVAAVDGESFVDVVLDGDGDGHHLTGEDSPFPMFLELAPEVAAPVTVFAFPMRPGGNAIGVLTCHAASGELAISLHDCLRLADAVGAALLGDRESLSATAPGWRERAKIHQATGMVIAQLGLPAEDALALLRAHAYAGGVTLDEVAERVVARQLSFATQAPGSTPTIEEEEES
ncbi:ANTAR domain-containing protein [Cellulosimicrobium sp. CUA-896]|uniref:ANTAR domain-containing protein n=1 Tax=Cellulosimicrobium sp. CUA-896 TaxID=1517881 RepID=UPI0009634528|nr:ANTAR domain-containing protein [Cellulosimicrobium sp. CUA-896]OLT46149.1 hypothetical protein BJF88_04880 [Cellulosimicrobium sp. CUA-896]